MEASKQEYLDEASIKIKQEIQPEGTLLQVLGAERAEEHGERVRQIDKIR